MTAPDPQPVTPAVPGSLIMPADEFAAVKTVASKLTEGAVVVPAGTVPDGTGRALATRQERSRERTGAAPALPLAGCPSPCDPDCEADCHQSHGPVHKRWHDPGWSCQMVQQAIAEAVGAERERAGAGRVRVLRYRLRAEAAERKLAAIEAPCRAQAGNPECPECGRGEALVRASDILAIIGTEGEVSGDDWSFTDPAL